MVSAASDAGSVPVIALLSKDLRSPPPHGRRRPAKRAAQEACAARESNITLPEGIFPGTLEEIKKGPREYNACEKQSGFPDFSVLRVDRACAAGGGGDYPRLYLAAWPPRSNTANICSRHTNLRECK